MFCSCVETFRSNVSLTGGEQRAEDGFMSVKVSETPDITVVIYLQ